MTATEVLDNLRAKGVTVALNAGQINLIAEPGVLNDADIAAVKEHKPALIDILTLPRHGLISRPMVVHGGGLTACPWDGCRGPVVAHKAHTDLHLCMDCQWWFRLIPMEGGDL
jgi:hypothetical protein